jgi:translocation and assembly module TamB
VERVTVSDAEGVWLELDGVEVVWTRTALFRRMLDIDSLRAERVTVLRKPVAGDVAGAEDSSGLPVEVAVDAFTLPLVTIAAPVAGAAAQLSAEGSAQFTEGTLAARLAVQRQDRPGQLSADLRLQPEENVLTADVQFAEPAGGLVADLLELRGRPAVSLALAGTGSLASWTADLQMQANGTQVLFGEIGVAQTENGHRVTADLTGALETIAPEAYSGLVKGESRLAFDLTRAADGALAVDRATLRSEGVELDGSGKLAPDLVPSSAELSLRVGQAGRTVLPFVPGDISVANLQATMGVDEGEAPPWRIELRAEGAESAVGRIGNISVSGLGRASNPGDSATRAVSFRFEAAAAGLMPDDPAVAKALGSTVQLASSGSWAAGKPVAFEELQAVLTGASVSFSGTANAARAEGRFGASSTDLSRFAALAGRTLSGGVQLQANGSIGLRAGDFDLQVDGDATDLGLGIAALDPLLAGKTDLWGGITRASGALAFRQIALSNQHARAELTGSFAAPALDLNVEAALADISSLTPRAKGGAQISARVTGTTEAPEVTATATGADLVLMGRPLADGKASFSGIVAGPRTGGAAELSGMLGDVAIKGAAQLQAGANGARTLDDLLITVGQSRAAGNLTIGADGLLNGQLGIASPDISQVAPLFLVEAGGMVKADVRLSAQNGGQAVTVSGTAADLVYETVTLDSADISGQASDLFSAPKIDGTFAIRNLKAGGLEVLSANGTAARQGESTRISAEAELRMAGPGQAARWSRAGMALPWRSATSPSPAPASMSASPHRRPWSWRMERRDLTGRRCAPVVEPWLSAVRQGRRST